MGRTKHGKKNSNHHSLDLSSSSDSDNDSDDEIMSFQTRRFVAKENVCTNNVGNDSDSSSSSDDCILKRRAGRTLNSTTIKSKRSGKFVAKRQVNTLHLDSSSSSSSDSDVSMTKNDSRKRPKSRLVTMLDSDSDDDTASFKLDTSLLSQESNRTSVRKQTTKTTSENSRIASSRHQRKDQTESSSDPKTADIMKKAKEAQEKLLMAQNYQADDLDLSIELDEIDCDHDHLSIDNSINDDKEPKQSIHVPNTSIHNSQPPSGPSIKISLRTNITTNSKLQDKSFTLNGNKTFFRMQLNDKMQTLLQNYKSKFSSEIPSNSDVKFSFDGETLELNQTPGDLDMEDEDLIDVLVKWPEIPIMDTTISTQKATQRDQTLSNESVIITTRIKGGDRNITHKYQLRKRDGFTKLVQAYREKHGYGSFKTINLFYRGEELDLNSSPDLEDMPKQVDIEVDDETERENQLTNGFPHPQPPACSSKVIQLKIRKNGNDKTMQKYSIGLSDKFNVLVSNFLRKNELTMTECQFIFEGESLNLQGTPDDEDLEGDEIIDVQISSKKISPNKQSSKIRKPYVESQKRSNTKNEMIISLTSDSESDDHDDGSEYHDAHEYIEAAEDDVIMIVAQPEMQNTRKTSQAQSRIGNYFSSTSVRSATSKSSAPTINIASSNRSPIVIQTYRNNVSVFGFIILRHWMPTQKFNLFF